MCSFSLTYNNIYCYGAREIASKKKKCVANELPGIKSINSNNEPVPTTNLSNT